ESLEFYDAVISSKIFDFYQKLDTSRGEYHLLTYNKETLDEFRKKSDLYYYKLKLNYKVVIT
ncbi:MAG: hypothetical protein ACFFG0_51585, partial [Candidatus Thorarchaeota archaeon]